MCPVQLHLRQYVPKQLDYSVKGLPKTFKPNIFICKRAWFQAARGRGRRQAVWPSWLDRRQAGPPVVGERRFASLYNCVLMIFSTWPWDGLIAISGKVFFTRGFKRETGCSSHQIKYVLRAANESIHQSLKSFLLDIEKLKSHVFQFSFALPVFFLSFPYL